MADDIITRDSQGNLAVNTVSSTEASVPYNYDDCFTIDTNGRRALRVVGGGDQHNLGWYATSSDLQTAYPTATAGDWAIVGATDTVWLWDTDNSEWKDSDQKGQVTSVNNQTGAVTLDINDVAPTQTDKSGYVLGTDGFVAGWVKPEIVQRSALPQASEEEVGNIYQYVGTTDANYTNGYFYKCVSDGQQPATYSWENIEVQEAGALPSQTGNAGKFLTTNGTDANWGSEINPLTITGSSSGSILLTGKVSTNTVFLLKGYYLGTGPILCFEVGTNVWYNLSSGGFTPTVDYSRDLGESGIRWNHTYTKYINNGSNITVPNQAGTMVVANPPTTDGTYVLKATVSSGVATYTWVAE